MDNWAFGTGENAIPFEKVLDEAKTIPARYFGGQTIGNDPSMQQMQHDLLAFDDKLTRFFFRRKKNKRSKKQNYSDEQYYTQNRQYYDQTQESIPEEDEDQLSSIYADNNPQTTNKNSSWQCRYCNAENKSMDIICRQCKQIETRF